MTFAVDGNSTSTAVPSGMLRLSSPLITDCSLTIVVAAALCSLRVTVCNFTVIAIRVSIFMFAIDAVAASLSLVAGDL